MKKKMLVFRLKSFISGFLLVAVMSVSSLSFLWKRGISLFTLDVVPFG